MLSAYFNTYYCQPTVMFTVKLKITKPKARHMSVIATVEQLQFQRWIALISIVCSLVNQVPEMKIKLAEHFVRLCEHFVCFHYDIRWRTLSTLFSSDEHAV